MKIKKNTTIYWVPGMMPLFSHIQMFLISFRTIWLPSGTIWSRFFEKLSEVSCGRLFLSPRHLMNLFSICFDQNNMTFRRWLAPTCMSPTASTKASITTTTRRKWSCLWSRPTYGWEHRRRNRARSSGPIQSPGQESAERRSSLHSWTMTASVTRRSFRPTTTTGRCGQGWQAKSSRQQPLLDREIRHFIIVHQTWEFYLLIWSATFFSEISVLTQRKN